MATRLALFIDGSNMFHAQKRMGYFLDYIKLKNHFSKGQDLFDSFYYFGMDTPSSEAQQKFFDYLVFNDFTVRKKDVKTIYDDESGEPVKKCNLDIEIAIDMFDHVDNYDKAILFSGDGDFERVVRVLRGKGKIIDVASCRGMIAKELANEANHLVYLEDYERYIKRTDRPFEKKEKKQIRQEKKTRC